MDTKLSKFNFVKGCGATKKSRGGMDIEIHREAIPVERKTFAFSLRQNPRGRFLKITEEVGGHRDTIIMPSTGLQQLRMVIDNLIEADKKAGPVVPPSQAFETSATQQPAAAIPDANPDR